MAEKKDVQMYVNSSDAYSFKQICFFFFIIVVSCVDKNEIISMSP